MTISAIILNYKNYSDLKDCLRSLKDQVLPEGYTLKILIIDNGSKDDSTSKIQAEFPDYEYVYNEKNLGFAAGVNQGLKRLWTESDFFLLVNNDATLASNCLERLITAEKNNPNGAICGPAIFYKSYPQKIWQAGGYFSKLKLGIKVPEKNKSLTDKKQKEVDFISGCVMLINKKILAAIGLFDENFFFYGEDFDVCWRAEKAGHKIIYEPKAQAWHNIPEIAVSRTNPWVLNQLAKSYFLIIQKHFPHFQVYGLFLFFFIYSPFRLIQIIRGKQPLKNISAWLTGGLSVLKTKLKTVEYPKTAKKRLAFFITRPPFPLVDGTRQFINDTVRALSKEFIIDLWLATDEKLTPEIRQELSTISGGNLFYNYEPRPIKYFKILTRFFSSRPWQVFYFYSSAFAKKLTRQSDRYAAFYFHTLRSGLYIDALEKSNPGIISRSLLDFNDAISLNYGLARRKARGLWKLIYAREEKRLQTYELELLNKLNYLAIRTENDKNYLENNWQKKYGSSLTKPITVLRHSIDDNLLSCSYEPKTDNLVFIGNLHYPPNKQGLKNFCDHVWPLIIKKRPKIKLLIIGRGGEEFKHFPNTELLGFVPDPYQLMSNQTLGINPVEFGAGISTKALINLAVGLPLISTKNGLSGLETEQINRLAFIIDYQDPKKAADIIIAALEDEDKRKGMSHFGKEFIKASYLKSENQKKIIDLMRLISDRQPGK